MGDCTLRVAFMCKFGFWFPRIGCNLRRVYLRVAFGGVAFGAC